jgi:hypothetical protein
LHSSWGSVGRGNFGLEILDLRFWIGCQAAVTGIAVTIGVN